MSLSIAYILKMYPRFSETFIVNEILELERQGVDVRVYSLRKPDDGRFHRKLADVKAKVIYVPQYPQYEVARIREAHTFLRQAYPERYATVKTYTEKRGHDAAVKRFLQAGYVAAHLLRHPVDAMHAHFATSATRVANLVNRLTGIEYSVTAHAKDIFHETVKADSLRNKLGAARFVVTVSNFNRTYLHGLLGEDSAEIRTLYNGIDLRDFRPKTTPRTPNRILAVGRLVEKKGFHYLIDACALLKERGLQFDCHIIGKGEWETRLKNQIAATGTG
ncbi:MAG TPA: colanic acid biosynthesis glycosyltransferase WcaL, partial [Anaerolineae bacterium]|nr:colanic acid biosynthesis glycosyltransferase WcaL [Anaerolineae bacterium]